MENEKTFRLLKPLSKKLIRDEDNFVIFEVTWEESSFMHGVEVIIQRKEEFVTNIRPDSVKTFTFMEVEFEVLSHEEFWGIGGKEAFLQKLKQERPKEMKLANGETLLFDDDGNALPTMKIFSINKLLADNKNTMAHIMFELGIFKSVNDARKNGWNKPLELGEFCVTKKKITFKVIE